MRIESDGIILRDMVEADIEDYVRWFSVELEWANWDAPWKKEDTCEETERKRWTEYYGAAKDRPDDAPRSRFEIEWNGRHIGWVNSYHIDGNYEWVRKVKEGQKVYRAVGINICEPGLYGNGIGTSTLRAFINYFFENGVNELYTQTWSGNIRMIRCAEKLGFVECDREVGELEVDGQSYDGLTFKLIKDISVLPSGINDAEYGFKDNKTYNSDEYIHPRSSEIEGFISELHLWNLPLSSVVETLLRWFDDNIAYSRLNAPYYPLQRSDLDLLKMRSGTCGDYSNLIVSVLTRLGYKTKYAYVHVDCYGNPQDHICAAVWSAERWQLIDATLPYRQWHGVDCPHLEYELLSYDDMREKLKQEEQYWTNKAIEWKKESFAGLLYAPWIHEEIVLCTDNSLETVFFLLMLNSINDYNILVYYLVYSEAEASSAIMCRVSTEGIFFRFSVNRADNIWDEKQLGEEFAKENIPECYCSDRLLKMIETLNRVVPLIQGIMNP